MKRGTNSWQTSEPRASGRVPNIAIQPSHSRVTALAKGGKRHAARRAADRARYTD